MLSQSLSYGVGIDLGFASRSAAIRRARHRRLPRQGPHCRPERLLHADSNLALGDAATLTGLAYHQHDLDRGSCLPVQGTLLTNPNGRIAQCRNLGDSNDEFERRQYRVGYDPCIASASGPRGTAALQADGPEQTRTSIFELNVAVAFLFSQPTQRHPDFFCQRGWNG